MGPCRKLCIAVLFINFGGRNVLLGLWDVAFYMDMVIDYGQNNLSIQLCYYLLKFFFGVL